MKKLLQNRLGIASVEFLIYACLISFMIFGTIDYWVVQQRVNQVEHIKNYYLDRVRLEGYLTTEDETTLASKLEKAKFNDIEISATASESRGDSRILRNIEDLDDSEVYLKITCKPVPQPFILAQLIGSGTPEPFVIDVSGGALSERVDP